MGMLGMDDEKREKVVGEGGFGDGKLGDEQLDGKLGEEEGRSVEGMRGAGEGGGAWGGS